MCADFTSKDYPPHVHEALVVSVTESGGSVIKSRGVEEEAPPTGLFVFNLAEPHAGWMGRCERWRYRWLSLTQDALDSVAARSAERRVGHASVRTCRSRWSP